MSKQSITWIELINKKIAERKAKGLAAGVGDVTGEAKSEWDDIKAGKHDKYVQGKATRKAKKVRADGELQIEEEESDSSKGASTP